MDKTDKLNQSIKETKVDLTLANSKNKPGTQPNPAQSQQNLAPPKSVAGSGNIPPTTPTKAQSELNQSASARAGKLSASAHQSASAAPKPQGDDDVDNFEDMSVSPVKNQPQQLTQFEAPNVKKVVVDTAETKKAAEEKKINTDNSTKNKAPQKDIAKEKVVAAQDPVKPQQQKTL